MTTHLRVDRKMRTIFIEFKEAQHTGIGSALAATITPVAPPSDPDRLRNFYYFTNFAKVQSDIRYALLQDRSTGVKLSKQEGNAWVEVFVAYWKAVAEIVEIEESPQTGNWTKVFNAWKQVANLLIRGYTNGGFQAWTLPCIYVVGRYLRIFAMEADASTSQDSDTFNNGFQDDVISDSSKHAKLEDSSQIINRMFTLCLHDRAPIEESRKWGVYNTVNLSFKTYFKLGAVSSCKSLLRAIDASHADLPPFSAFPKSHIVTFKYYLGVICFLEENYAEAEEHLSYAWKMCHPLAKKNKELILTYLIPCHIVTTHTLPTLRLLAPYPLLEKLFSPLCKCIKKGDLTGFDAAMAAGENEFVKKRIYLPLERGRDIALRNLFRKVFLAGGYDPPVNGQPPIRRTRIPVAEFAAAIRLGNKVDERVSLDMDEVECFLANLIYKNLMKGYISRERAIVVLSKGGTAFPGTGV
ncbi:COP9 signalosome complex subunit [Histoplasma capsulatum G186AR]|uniref:Protein CSN12 homolog n=2 Tax=Ajellomyces capsulatus TaxID=5037 RepID=C0NCE2_AJECG|nr:COP9 signalosome complex subunit [Histoplasma capsulatum G186AR]EEH11333.1 COP9 signalosome complex subunit [Histoplasma capsulatum G186AR]KAG5302821.1 COP9 signalosome complex subunit [Histoplasma capsulatum]QSS71779.1 COP9 signalosome complex subunit [Histoplasma capsulatum G186AR]